MSSDQVLRYFERDHLPKDLKLISEAFRDLASELASLLEGDPELEIVLRKLLDAKDCAARAVLYAGQEATMLDSAALGQPDGPVGGSFQSFDGLLALKRHAPVVYFVRNGNRVKIGYTQSLRNRIGRLSLRPKDLVRVEHGGATHERSLHERFAAYRIGDTEWFELRGEVADHVTKQETIQDRIMMTLAHYGEMRRRDLEALIGLTERQTLDALRALKPAVERTERDTWRPRS
jgi:hypothetical protein